MARKILCLFPGQGSQKVSMGQLLYNQLDSARKLFSLADKTLGFPLSEVCFNGPPERLTATEVAQPAILTVSVICYRLFLDHLPPDWLPPVAAAGHSLGEYSALVAAEALTFEDAVLLVHKRGKYMQEAVPPGQGAMAAILGKELNEIEEALKQVTQGLVQIANLNAPGQVVVAGEKVAVDELLAAIPDAKAVPLAVSAPFHCALMKPAAEKLAQDLAKVTFHPARFPIYSNFSARPISQPDEIRQALENQVCGRVRWVECMQNAIYETNPDLAIEFGYGNTLSGLLKRIDPRMARYNVDSLSAVEELRRTLG